ncbi:serine hydrolase domain-containing protein [Enterococcus sp. LJL90]
MLNQKILNELAKQYIVPNVEVCSITNGKLEEYSTNTEKEQIGNMLFNACSISKLVTAVLVLQLASEGKLEIDTPINQLIKNLPLQSTTGFPTLRQLLSHTAGIQDPAGSFDVLELQDAPPKVLELLLGKTIYCKEKISITTAPNQQFDYSDAGYAVVEYVVEELLQEPFTRLVEERIFSKLGMTNSFYPENYAFFAEKDCVKGYNKDNELIANNYSIYPYASGAGLWSTPRDLAKLLVEISAIFSNKSQLGIEKNFYDEMKTAPDYASYAGLGVFLDVVENQIEFSSFGWGQGYQCGLLFYPETAQGLVVMTNKDSGVHQLKGVIGAIFEEWSKG